MDSTMHQAPQMDYTLSSLTASSSTNDCMSPFSKTPMNAYTAYIRTHALRYVGEMPSTEDPSYAEWNNKLQKVETVLHNKYINKLSQSLEQQEHQLHTLHRMADQNDADSCPSTYMGYHTSSSCETIPEEMSPAPEPETDRQYIHSMTTSASNMSSTSNGSGNGSGSGIIYDDGLSHLSNGRDMHVPDKYRSPFDHPGTVVRNEILDEGLVQRIIKLQHELKQSQQRCRIHCQELAMLTDRCDKQKHMLVALQSQNDMLRQELQAKEQLTMEYHNHYDHYEQQYESYEQSSTGNSCTSNNSPTNGPIKSCDEFEREFSMHYFEQSDSNSFPNSIH